ncbi:hypothetical protein PPROV_000367900 [Pycnococcus provasolii]|uniref:Trafficking protein particle complex subunit 11 domain-containing protein n=1 Tax=Pycnococcus provasolii TaxID=41880 RepID=A0A830HIQ0_9CHLO|nr:hypothetical protein PPROV_000367900 [Pycnococcus provasolii]
MVEERALVSIFLAHPPPGSPGPDAQDASHADALSHLLTTATQNSVQCITAPIASMTALYPPRKRHAPAHVNATPATAMQYPLQLLKTNWLARQRTQRPGLAVFVATAAAASADPASWAQLCAQLDAVRLATNRRSAPMLIAVVGAGAVPEERLAALRRRADLDARSLVVVPNLSQPGSAAPLVTLASELSMGFYRDEARRRKAHLTSMTAELAAHGMPLPAPSAVKAHFKLGFFLEVVGDVQSAGKHYALAYGFVKSLLHELGTSRVEAGQTSPPPEKFAMPLEECRAMATLLFDKLCVLHAATPGLPPGDPGGELRKLVDTHVRFFRTPGGSNFASLPRVLRARHAAWLSRQCERGARALLTAGANHDACRFAAARLYDAAARILWQRRRGYKSALEAGLVLVPATPQAHAQLGVSDGVHLGTFASADGSVVGWDEYLAYICALEAHADGGATDGDDGGEKTTHAIVNDMLHAAYALYDSRSCERYRAAVAVAYAQEQELHGTGDESLAEAQRLLESALPLYRRERADGLRTEALSAYRGVLGKQGLGAKHAAASLELCACSTSMEPEVRSALQASTFASLGERDGNDEAPEILMLVSLSSSGGDETRLVAPGVLIVCASWTGDEEFTARVESRLPLSLPLQRATLEVAAEPGGAVTTSTTGACELEPGASTLVKFRVEGAKDGARPIRLLLESAQSRVSFEHLWRTDLDSVGKRFVPASVLSAPGADDAAPTLRRAASELASAQPPPASEVNATLIPAPEPAVAAAEPAPAPAPAPAVEQADSAPLAPVGSVTNATLRLEIPEASPLRGAPFDVTLVITAAASMALRVELHKANTQSVWAGSRARTIEVAAGTEARLTWRLICCQACDALQMGNLVVRCDATATTAEIPVVVDIR